jgi:hypothetical protein
MLHSSIPFLHFRALGLSARLALWSENGFPESDRFIRRKAEKARKPKKKGPLEEPAAQV